MRDITFSWAFYPKNYDEAKRVNEIIKILKRAALPKPWTGYSSGILSYPQLCQINFFPWDTGGNANSWGWTDNSIIRIKKCFLSNVSASYSDFGNPAFFHSENVTDTNYSVTYRLNVTFKEVEYILSRDWEDGVQSFVDGVALVEDPRGVARAYVDGAVAAKNQIETSGLNPSLLDGSATVTGPPQ
jgi:hypothetical protein